MLVLPGLLYIQPQLRKAGRDDSMNLKVLSDDKYENQESGRVFADSAHINATTAQNVISTRGVARTDRRGKTGV